MNPLPSSCIILLCGLPGVGKSTFAKMFNDFGLNEKIVHVEFDSVFGNELKTSQYEIEKQVPFDAEIWKKSRKKAFDLVESMISGSDGEYIIVLVDDNFYYSSMRYPFFKLAKRRN